MVETPGLTPNTRLIISQQQEPDPLFDLELKEQATKDTAWTRMPSGVLAGFVLVGLPLIGVGLFSSSSVRDADVGPFVENSQTVQLLEASINQDPKGAYGGIGGGDIEIVQDRALLVSAGPSGTLADIEVPQSNRISVYVVREGDNLSQIAEMFGVTSNTILWANDLGRDGLIRPGQTLVILPISGVRHEVEDGDTLKGIAKEYDGDLEEILVYNDLDVDALLSEGEIVIIPDGEVAEPVYSAPQGSSSTRIVKSGSNSGYYIRPSSGTRTQGIHGYNSVDIGSYYGSPIVASASGRVIVSKNSGYNGGYGNYVVIEHSNGSQTLYAHNSQNIVYSGQSVVQGQVIAYMGSSGNSTGSHVHFEIRNGITNPF